MSTFNGQILEIQNIGVDYFENKDLQCYFLSHCHSDHMKYLDNLSRISSPLYTTRLSALIVKQKYPLINIQILEYGFENSIEVIGDDGKIVKFVVTALNATGHCLGACMLLFQIEGLDILYTGDFRISLEHTKSIKLLNEIRNYKRLVLYLDTTFLNEFYKHFPSQRESCSKIIDIIDEHLKLSSSHKVYLQTSARYGYERLLIEINKKLKEPILIHETAVYEQYSVISDLIDCVTTDKHKARIILKPSYVSKSDTDKNNNSILNIQLSALCWRNWSVQSHFFTKTSQENSIRVCYATHNSLSELEDFITFLEPKSINATVIPNNANEKEAMMKLIKRIMKIDSESIENKKDEPKRKFRFKRLRDLINNEECDQIKKKQKQ